MALKDTAKVLGLTESEMLEVLGSPENFSDDQARALTGLFLPDSTQDAFVEQRGSKFAVIQGNNGRELSKWGTKLQAEEEVDRLHRKNKPSTSNRGARAKERHKKRDSADPLADAIDRQAEVASARRSR